jgi:hypothetical protein
MKRALFAVFLALASLPLGFAEQSGSATIVFYQGDDLQVIRNKKIIPLDEPMGFVLQPGDTLQTGKKTLAEIQTLPKKSVIKLAENTSFIYSGVDAKGETSGSVIYGRVRAKVAKLLGDDTYTLKSGSVVAGVRGTDFGIDAFFPTEESKQLLVRVYCFDGGVNVAAVEPSKIGATVPESVSSVDIHANESTVVSEIDPAKPLEKSAISADINSYWKENDFVSPEAKVLTAERAQTQVIVEKETIRIPFEQMPEYGRVKARKTLVNATLGGALLFIGTGTAVDGLAMYELYQNNTSMARSLILPGSISIGMGTLLAIGALIANLPAP